MKLPKLENTVKLPKLETETMRSMELGHRPNIIHRLGNVEINTKSEKEKRRNKKNADERMRKKLKEVEERQEKVRKENEEKMRQNEERRRREKEKSRRKKAKEKYVRFFEERMIYTRRNLKLGRIDDEALNDLKDIYADALANLDQKKEIIRILKQVLSPKNDIEIDTYCPQCRKRFCNKSYWMLHVINRHCEIIL